MKTITKKALAGIACSLMMAACGSTAFAQVGNFQKNPYLMFTGVSAGNCTSQTGPYGPCANTNANENVGNTSMEVGWQDTVSQTDTISWGTTTAYGHSASVPEVAVPASWNAAYGHQHFYTITGLTPGTKYYYQVSGTSISATGSFITAPPSNATAVKFIGMGDSRSQPFALANLQQAVQNLVAQPGNANFAALTVLNGDWVSTDGESYWTNEYFDNISSQKAFSATFPVAGAKGNHDNHSNNSATLPKYFPMPFMLGNLVPLGGTQLANGQDPYYTDLFGSFDYGSVHFTVVDEFTTDIGYNQHQYNWVASDLAAANSNPNTQWKILIYHEPAWSAGSDGDASAMQLLDRLVTEYGVDLVFCGHSHNYARTGAYNVTQAGGTNTASSGSYITPGVPHITTGGGGAPIYQPNITNFTAGSYPHVLTAWPSFEFMTFNVNGPTMTMTTYQASSPFTSGTTPFETTQLTASQVKLNPIETLVLNHFNQLTSGVTVTPSAVNCTPGATTTTCTSGLTVKNTGSSTIGGNIDVVLDGMINLQGIFMNWLAPTSATPCTSTLLNQYSLNKADASTTGAICSEIAMNTGLYDKVTLVNATSSQNGEPLIRATSKGLAAGASVTVPLTFSYTNVTGANGTYLNSAVAPATGTTKTLSGATYDNQKVSAITFCTNTQVPYAGTNGAGGTYCLNPIVYQE
ncbi:MAG: metallophosphoesterase family protein [Candidatus Korobacteraceae bacterium]